MPNFIDFEKFILDSVSEDELISGTFEDITDQAILAYSNEYGKEHKILPKRAMVHAYSNYEKRAFGLDELGPVSGNGKDSWGGISATMIDALDTLWLMDMKDEFFRARDWIRDNLNFDKNVYVSFFETIIREVGGLLSAYYLSGDEVFLGKAVDLGERVFAPVRRDDHLPLAQVNLKNGASKGGWLGTRVMLSEVSTCQMEFAALSDLTGNPEYKEKSFDMVRRIQETTENQEGIFPMYIDSRTLKDTSGTITLGARGDSFYEYLLKVWIQTGYHESDLKVWYDRSIESVIKHLLQKTKPNGLSFIADYHLNTKMINRKMDHLVCYFPGLLALGVYHSPNGKNNRRDMILAKQVMYTCVQMFLSTPTGLAPEFMENNGDTDDIEVTPQGMHNLLRPEIVESLYILHYVTRHPIYRIWGKQLMQNIEKYQRTNFGYGTLSDIRNTAAQPNDSMETFFFAETLKYHFLLQNEVDLIDLNEWVFNTEAHPLKILK